MPVFIAALIGGLVQAAGTLVGRVLISLGIGYATYEGLDTGLGWIQAQIAGSFGDLAAQTIAVLSGSGIGVAVSIVLSAISARLFLDGVVNGTLKRMVLR